jgi:hypothetical protein
MDEEFEGNLVKLVGLGERECLADEAREALPQGVVPALDMRGVPRLLAHSLMVAAQGAKDLRVRLLEVAEGGTVAVRGRNPAPQAPTTLLAAVPDEVGHHLPRAPTERYPDPAFVFLEPTQDQTSSSSSTSPGVASTTGGRFGRAAAASRSHLATVWRATPKVRSNPRSLERSW